MGNFICCRGCCDEEDDSLESVREGVRRVRFSKDVTIYTFHSEKAPAKTGVQQPPRLWSSAEIISAVKAYDRPSKKRHSEEEEASVAEYGPSIYQRGSENRAQRVRFSPQYTASIIDEPDEGPSTTRVQKRFRFLSNVEVPSAFMARYDRPGIKGRCMEEESRTEHEQNISERGSENRAQRVRFSPQVTEHFIDQEDEAPATTGVQPLPRLPSSAEIPSALKAYDRRSEKRRFKVEEERRTEPLLYIYRRGSVKWAERVHFSPQDTAHLIDQQDEAPSDTVLQELSDTMVGEVPDTVVQELPDTMVEEVSYTVVEELRREDLDEEVPSTTKVDDKPEEKSSPDVIVEQPSGDKDSEKDPSIPHVDAEDEKAAPDVVVEEPSGDKASEKDPSILHIDTEDEKDPPEDLQKETPSERSDEVTSITKVVPLALEDDLVLENLSDISDEDEDDPAKSPQQREEESI